MSKKMPWFKVWNEMVRDYKFDSLAISMGRPKNEMLGAWLTILTWASESPERGRLLITRYIRVTNADIYRTFSWEEEEAEIFLGCLVDLEMLIKDGEDYLVVNWNKRQDPKDKTGAARQKSYQERHSITREITRKQPVKSRVEDKKIEDRGQRIDKEKVQIPESLNAPEFIKAWTDWEKYRSEIKHKITDSTAQKQLAMLSKHPPGIAVAIIEQSIEKGWQGLFEINERKNGNSDQPKEDYSDLSTVDL